MSSTLCIRLDSKRCLQIVFSLWTAILFWGFEACCYSQQKSLPDTMTSVTQPSPTRKSELDTVVEYEAQRIESDAEARITHLINNAIVKYRGMILTAGKITINWDKNLLIAEGLPDTISTVRQNPGGSADSVTYRQFPQFSEAGQTISGERMTYNFKTKKGLVIRGRTKYEEGYYYGKKIKKVNDKVYFVKHGYFTTCSIPDTPHYHFESLKMKMIFQDKVIAKPIVLYIKRVPVAFLPFGIFPYRRGRHSGILIPRYGESYTEGRYLRGLGYYWAPSQYWDARLEVDYYEKTGFLFHGNLNYAIRYLLRGTLSGSLLRKHSTIGGKQRRWDLGITHQQQIDPTISLNIYGRFVSDQSYYRDFSANRQQRLMREIRSNATLAKVWQGKSTSLTINLSQVHNLDTESKTETLPRISFRRGQQALFELFKGRKKIDRYSWESRKDNSKKWYESIYFSYFSQLINQRQQFKVADQWQRSSKLGVNHQLNFSSPQKIFRWFTVSQSLSYREIWVDRRKEYYWDWNENKVKSRNVFGFAARRTFTASIAMSTKLYGMFYPHIGQIQTLRHVLTPGISFSYHPDFSDPKFGYYQTIVDTGGKIYSYDRFDGSLFGSTPRGAEKNLSFSLRNLFQLKTGSGVQEKKIDLFTFDTYSSYNFEADSLNFSSLVSSFRAQPFRNVSVLINFTHSLYKFDVESKRKVNQYLFDKNPWAPLRLTNFRLSSNIRLSSSMFRRKKTEKPDTTSLEEELPGETLSRRFDVETMSFNQQIPWSINLSINYNLNKSNPQNPTRYFWLNLTSSIQLTTNWRLRYNARFDLEKKTVVAQDVMIYRDLHCWEASFAWTPTGPYKRFYLRINVKAPMLRELKVEKRGGRAAFFGY